MYTEQPQGTGNLLSDVAAEQSILGSMLISPYAAEIALSMLAPADFWRPVHQRVFSAMVTVSARGEAVDGVTVSSELTRERGETEDTVSMLDYLRGLAQYSVSRTHIAHHARIILEHATRRRLALAGQEVSRQAYDLETPLQDVVAGSESLVMDATVAQRGGDTFALIATALPSVFSNMEARGNAEGIPGISSGIRGWDALTLGFQRSGLYIFAARPGMGKSAAACGIMASAAKDGRKVAVFSLEMTRQEIIERVLSALAMVDMSSIGRGRLTREEMKAMDTARRIVSPWPVAIDDSPGTTVSQILSRSRRIRTELAGLDMVIVDYLGLIKPDPTKRHGTRAEEVSEIAKGLKMIAKTLEIPVVALAQISRNVERQEDKRPKLSDLKESGGIEENADVVTGLYRPCYYKSEEMQIDGSEPAEWIVLKGRNVRTGIAKTIFHPKYTRFDDAGDSIGGTDGF